MNNQHYKNIHIKDLSLSGLYAQGHFNGQLCDECDLLMKTMDNQYNTYLKLPCRLVRVFNNGIALEFMYPNQDCLILLETVILYYAEDPFTVAREFPDISFSPTSSNCT